MNKITIEDIGVYLSPMQLTALRQHGDPLPTIIADITAWVRSEIQSDDIPRTATCHLIIEALQSRIPTLKLSDDQVRNANNARLHLKKVHPTITSGRSKRYE